jgi:DNA polymerase-3 subunit gamma/tau
VKSGRVAHAFLFTGSRGVGKTSAARILAKCMNCDEGPSAEPCNQCTSCREITEGRSLDVYEIDGASNTSVDDVRELRENIKYMPRPGKKRIYIIDEVHMLSRSAFNALLKTLEEPPEHVLFVFATTEPHKVPETIQSRCQRFDFRRIPGQDLLARLREIADKEALTISETALSCIVKAADGSMRDAQSLLDQVISYCGASISDDAVMDILGMAGRDLFFRISGAVFRHDAAGCLEALDELYRKGYDISQFYRDLVEHFRNLLIAHTLPKPGAVLEMSEGEIEELTQQAGQSSLADLQRLVSVLLKAEADVLRSGFPRVGLEITLVRLAGLANLESLEQILNKLDTLVPRPGPESGPRGRRSGAGKLRAGTGREIPGPRRKGPERLGFARVRRRRARPEPRPARGQARPVRPPRPKNRGDRSRPRLRPGSSRARPTPPGSSWRLSGGSETVWEPCWRTSSPGRSGRTASRPFARRTPLCTRSCASRM